MSDRLKSVAPSSVAGILFQFERALYFLASSDADASVGIETLGDVTVISGETQNIILEEDKHSLSDSGYNLQDRSVAIWKTLANWLKALSGRNVTKLLFVTNSVVSEGFLFRLGKTNKTDDDIAKLVEEVRVQKKLGTEEITQIERYIANVNSYSDDSISDMMNMIELVDRNGFGDPIALKLETASRLLLPEGVLAEEIIQGLSGWLQKIVMELWRDGKEAWVERKAFTNQLHHILSQRKRSRIRESAKRYVPVTSDEIENEHSSKFVHHLALIEVDDSIVESAIIDYLCFSKEKFRLIAEGVVNDDDWTDRGERLSDRWKRIANRERTLSAHQSAEEVGRGIYFSTTGEHCESLAGDSTCEIYLTAGHYQRMANDDAVWWYPSYTPGKSEDESE